MLLKGTITVSNTVTTYADPNNQEKKVIFKNFKVNLFRTWSANCFIVARTANNHKLAFTIADTKLYVPAVQQLKAGFRKAIN